MLKLGNLDVIKMYLGDIEVPRAYLGDIEVYSVTPKESYAIATFNVEEDGQHCILGSRNYFDYSQLDRITIDGEDYDFMNNGREVYLTEGEHTVTYYAKATMTACNDMWVGCGRMTSIDVSNWNTSQITTIKSAFHTCASLTSIIGLENWDVSLVTDMGYLFYECQSLTSIDLRYWDLSNVLNMGSMFNNSTITSLYVNSPLNSNVNTYNMFSNVETDGTFYYNDEYDNTAIIGAIPSTWTAVPYNFE